MRILAVDDDSAVSQALFFALTEEDWQLVLAGSVSEAMAELATGPFDVVITDNQMPVRTGLELVQWLREQKFKGKIVVLTAYLSEQLEKQYSAFRVDRLMAKPFNVGELRRTIEKLGRAA